MENITSQQVKNMSMKQLKQLCQTLRKEIIDGVLKTGGHLSSNLGTIELTVALHYVFDFPNDKLIFDVGHQCYAHKLLTGRADKFSTIRCEGGISGFPKREESLYDCYNTGHAGTSVSAAIGMAKARDILGDDYSVVALIGDGSFNNGLIYEAFNSLKPLNTNILLILNDNGMSISPTVGSMHEYLTMLSEDSVQKAKKKRHSDIFERFGFIYDGIYDGNDIECIIEKLIDIKEKLKNNSIILHVITKKGKGYAFCEEHPDITHGVSGASSNKNISEYSTVLGETLCRLAQSNKNIVAVTAAMTSALGLSQFFETYPKRSIDVGICEEHATILCAAMAASGLKPYYAVYSTFLQRSYDEIIIDICSQDLPVTLCIDRAGISGPDGETHQGVFDLSMMLHIPNLTVAVPKDINEFIKILEFSAKYNHPLAIRYPRSCNNNFGEIMPINEDLSWEWMKISHGKFVVLASGERAISIGSSVCEQLSKDGIEISLINSRFVKPLDLKVLKSIVGKYIITIEDNALIGGFGASIACYFADTDTKVKNFAYMDKFIPHGNISSLMNKYGLDKNKIIDYIKENEN